MAATLIHPGLTVGTEYEMTHTRKGRATVEVLAINGEWIDVRVVRGSLQGIGADSYRGVGDSLTVRASLVRFAGGTVVE